MGLSEESEGRVVEPENQSMNVIQVGMRRKESFSVREEVRYSAMEGSVGRAQFSALK